MQKQIKVLPKIILALTLLLTHCNSSTLDDSSATSTTSTANVLPQTQAEQDINITIETSPDSITLSTQKPIDGQILFVSNRDGNDEIYVMNADGSQQTRLTYNSWPDYAPVWSPDGQQIAFVSYVDGNYEIYTMNADGDQLMRLTHNTAVDGQPSWSPDDKYIAFVSDRDGDEEIYRMNVDGTSQMRLTNSPARDSEPIWSPDGKYIAFVSERDSSREIYVMNADGSQQRRLTNPSTDAGNPAWSPDGQYIVFSSTRDSQQDVIFVNSALYMVSIDGGEPIALTDSSSLNISPVWSPDGNYIAFVSDRDSARGRVYKLYLMEVATREVRRLTDDDMLDYPVPYEFGPTWSPDGQYLSFRLNDGAPKIYIIHIENGQLFQLTDGDARNQSPHWWAP